MNARKIATSLPAPQYLALERTRKRLHLRRSEAVQQALTLWLAARERGEKVAAYVAGHKANPEDGLSDSLAAAWAAGQKKEDWG